MMQERKTGKRFFINILVVIMILCSVYSGYQVAIAARGVMATENRESADELEEDIASELSTTRTRGDDDTFTILEIVPYRGMGEIGYMVGGCEPIDLSKLKTREYDGFTSFLGEMLLVRDTYVEKEVLTKEDKEQYMDWSDVYVAKEEKGTFQLVEPYTGEYVLESSDVYVVDQSKHGSYNAKLSKLVFNKNRYGKMVKDNNVNAWFYSSKQSNRYTSFDGTEYTVANATKNEQNTGDYDYDRLENLFILNKGKGAYDVQFMPYAHQRNQEIYYMASEYEIVEDCTGEYTGDIVYVNAPDTDRDGLAEGKYSKANTEHYVFVGPGMGNYNFISDEQGGQLYLIHKKYSCRKGVEYINAEWFKRYAMRLDAAEWDSCNIEVVTRTPEEVNAEPELIARADMLFLSPTQQNTAYVGLWEFYGKEKEMLGVTEDSRYTISDLASNGIPVNLSGIRQGKVLPTFINNDLNWNVTYELFERIGVKQDLPTVLNCVMYENNCRELSGYSNSTSNNCAKLYLMLRQWNPQIFYENFFETNKIKEGTFRGITTGEYIEKSGDERFIWYDQTFWPELPIGNSNPYEYYRSLGIDNPYMMGNESVVGNIYTFNGDCIVDNMFLAEQHYSGEWFYEVNAFLYEDANGYEATPEEIAKMKLSTADIFYYLLRYKKANFDKAEIVVLDLEPCNDFTLTEIDVKNMINGYSGDVRIVKMTTAEFNGKIEDLNKEYDMIYMGLNIGMMNTSNGLTRYNDSNLNGMIYLHVGDCIRAGNALAGLVDGIDTYRFSGNDITTSKEKELEQFVRAGYPIVASSDLYTLNTSRIDPYSNIYSFVKKMKTGSGNIINASTFANAQTKAQASNKLKNGLAIEKPKLNFTSMPVMYNGDYPDVLSLERKLSYKFSIADLKAEENSKMTYTVKLYIDANADGRYADNELQATLSLVKAGEEIQLQKTLGASHVGIIPWKIVVYRTDNPNIRSSQIGYYAIKRSNAEKKVLKILQITSTRYSRYDWTGSTMNLQQELANTNTLFSKYAKNLNDFVLDITTIDVNQFVDWYVGNTNGRPNAYDKDNPDSVDRLKGYDMLIFGFGDSYTDIKNTNGALDNVFAFVESGKSVLFTHDTTSVVNKENGSDTHTSGVMNWGYNINQYLRDRIGMNRFGVKTKGEESSSTNSEGKDIAYSPSGSIYKEIQGYSYGAMIQYGIVAGDKGSDLPSNQFGPVKTFVVKDSRNQEYPEFNSYKTNSIANVNQGQITEYPYKIPKPTPWDNVKMSVGETHAQYYELDMEDSEIVVWYCLSNDENNKLYSSSPNDVRNNYYIYNKGNITYTGAGHRYFGSNEDEVKLFINTMVAAYRATIAEPEIDITNGVDNDEGVSFVYVDCDFDDNLNSSAAEDKVKISFT
ncbi:DUF5057 domain-containing protein, partial [Anaerosporobacter sp.]|uniref:DUF5057 domain-containing protein n=1 Tax=Anaerosporobacter sp. TaxID=1872529 RepID=UPI00286F6DA7